mmetsp:Transcript_4249/g.6777  ORF Transcript_4249/g.6777 Transcript_4249/m.6777 type:complete len:164 (+) Transcript_4249:179-670(+)|eukprot:CAMPEP_0201601472 /NCGR_PEP_ID=MMETSP0492-20130828/2435_1 /ASSEMBLY_ACC=CAM_ASM_000837 /TAXON_ID=420259 /ORGANISM="Thalassiosira gravida, Strain GMp14c1" /LENGTH=163 /DNA_ID=CAMNT_0048064703 /DNA_START=73 /DNA_END=564 /DNA_ORIENTATION=-
MAAIKASNLYVPMTDSKLRLESLSFFLRGFDHDYELTINVDIGIGDSLILHREDQNPYDSNAVRATDCDGPVFGRVARERSKSYSALLLVILPLDIQFDVHIDKFKSKGYRNTEIHCTINFKINQSSSLERKYQSLLVVLGDFKGFTTFSCLPKSHSLLIFSI